MSWDLGWLERLGSGVFVHGQVFLGRNAIRTCTQPVPILDRWFAWRQLRVLFDGSWPGCADIGLSSRIVRDAC